MFKDFDFDLHSGRVLTQFSFLKKDDRYNYRIDGKWIKVEGAPGFHGSDKIFSLGQPTLIGIENIIKFLGEKKIVWINLKEEPTIYINNFPYIVREIDNPYSNISSFRSITSKNLETLENVLKEDVLNESKTQRGFIHTFDEIKEMNLEKKITYVYRIMTNKEVCYHLKSKGYEIDYYRVPFPVEQFFSVCQSMNLLIDILEKHRGDDCIFLLTSSNDTKRSLFVLILIKIFYLKEQKRNEIIENSFISDNNQEQRENIFEKDSLTRALSEININSYVSDGNTGVLKDYFEKDLENISDIISILKSNWIGTEAEFYSILKLCLDGNFRIINNLMFVIGEDSKTLVDHFVDKHSFPVNLRKNIVVNYLKASVKNDEQFYKKALLSLERYLTLLLFSKYMSTYKKSSNVDFISWFNNKPVLTNLLDYINEHRHINKALFPLNLLNSEIRSNLFEGMSKIGRFTMLMEFTNIIDKSFEDNIFINSYPNTSAQTGIWLNTREEPCIYIKDKMYVLKELINYHSNPTCFSGITNKGIEAFEIKIKENLIKEYEKEGKIMLFRSTEEDIEEYYMTDVNPSMIETSKEHIERVLNKNIVYKRVPITAKIALKVTLFDQISDICLENKSNDFYIQCGGAGSRGVYTAIIIDLKLGLSKESLKNKTFIKPIHSLIRILAKGGESFDRVNYLYSKYFGETFVLSTDDSMSDKEIEARIKNVFLLVCFASFCFTKKEGTFLEFYNKRKDIQNLFNSIDLKNNKEEIFIVLQNEYLENLNVIKNRTGKVLGPMTILKSDFFIGSIVLKQKKESNFPGNFRYIVENEIIYAGCAMPTRPGVESALAEFELCLKKKCNPLWICLREEPVIYMDGSPYALRYVTKLCENIETIGISYGTVENVEEELCLDAKNELLEGNILLHDELMKEGKIRDIGRYVKVNLCETVNNFFSKFNLQYLRVPVTDEKAPSPSIIDFFISKLKNCGEINAYVFNCQMGRGRTTTTMIIFYLINNPHVNPDLPSYPPKYKLIGRIMQVLPNSPTSKSVLDSAIDKFDHIENIRNAIDRYLVGNYYVRKKGKDYLLRYFNLLIFTEYILFGREESFVMFLNKHPEIQSIAQEIDVFELDLI